MNLADFEGHALDAVVSLEIYDKLLAEVKRLRVIADEWGGMWEILEEEYPSVCEVITKELEENKIGTWSVLDE